MYRTYNNFCKSHIVAQTFVIKLLITVALRYISINTHQLKMVELSALSLASVAGGVVLLVKYKPVINVHHF